ncbi:MAG: ATP-binding cassette domain-containing protein [Streptosporangiales bacterium]|nr:ATP-binding cassette domain-containing protein [Streptosporangiales bacterium]
MASLTLQDVGVQYGDVAAVRGMSLDVEEGEFVTLLGPSGCGKTTILRAIAGLEPCTGGQIRIGGELVAGPGVHVPPEKRGVNMVFQTYAVWPHMSVFGNVAFGLKIRRRPRSEIRAKVKDALELVGLAAFSDRYATQLSGGQQQRVALARAIVTEPRLLLFDEPLSNLDAGLREQMRVELRELHSRIGKTAIYVTHDQSEAMVMSDRVVLMNGGDIEQVGTPRELYEGPRTRFAAEFLGIPNLWPARVVAGDGTGAPAVAELGSDGVAGCRVAIDRVKGVEPGTRGIVAVRAERVEVCRDRPGGSGVNVWDGTVEVAAYLGGRVESRIRSSDDLVLRAETKPSLELVAGDPVFVVIPPDAFVWIPTPPS